MTTPQMSADGIHPAEAVKPGFWVCLYRGDGDDGNACGEVWHRSALDLPDGWEPVVLDCPSGCDNVLTFLPEFMAPWLAHYALRNQSGREAG